MLAKMLENKDIGCGYSKQNRNQVAAFWKELETVLNRVGPPTKSAFEWKKVWTDQKRYVRKKVSTNLQHSRGTGGGPNKTVPLFNQERTIYELIGAKEGVEGLAETQVLWHKINDEDDVQIMLNEVLPTCSSPSPSADVLSANSTDYSTVTLGSPRLNKQKLTHEVAVKQELQNQQQLYEKIAEAVNEIKNFNKENIVQTKRVYRALENSNELKKEIIELEKKKYEETVRHNKIIEELKKNQNCY